MNFELTEAQQEVQHRARTFAIKEVAPQAQQSDASGEFAGKFRGDRGARQPISAPDEDGQFEVVYQIRDFTLDPCVRDREEELADKPDDLVLNGVWAFTHTGRPSGLEVSEVELISPEQGAKKTELPE